MHMTIQKQQLGCEQKIVAIILISRGARTDWSMQPSTLSGIAAKVRAHQSTLPLMTAPPFPTNHQILFAWRSLRLQMPSSNYMYFNYCCELELRT